MVGRLGGRGRKVELGFKKGNKFGLVRICFVLGFFGVLYWGLECDIV